MKSKMNFVKRRPVSILFSIGFLLTMLGSCSSENKTYPAEWIKFRDKKTGNEVWQITNNDSINEAPYFYVNSFTSDDRYVIFRSKRAGNWDMYRCDLTNGKITRLTKEGISDACILPDGENMAFISGWKYYKMNVNTLKKTMILDFTGKLPSKPLFRPSITNNGKYTIVYTRQDSKLGLYRVNLETGQILKVMERNGGSFSHQLINPGDQNLITYIPLPDTQDDMTLPMEKRPRTRIINVEKGTDDPFLIVPYGFRATHDSWSGMGNRYFFFEKTVPDWIPVSIASIDLEGNEYTKIYSSDSIKLGHGSASGNLKWFICDGQEPNNNPLILINIQDKKSKIICWPDASIDPPSNVHVHPNFSVSGNFIVYTSDVAAKNKHQVYVIPLKGIKDNW